MLNSSAPQNSTRKGSCCLDVPLDHRMPAHCVLYDSTNVGRRLRLNRGIEEDVVVEKRSEVHWKRWTLIGSVSFLTFMSVHLCAQPGRDRNLTLHQHVAECNGS